MEIATRYRWLRAIALLVVIISWIVLIVGVIVTLAFLLSGPGTAGLWIGGTNWTGALLLPYAIYAFVQLFVTGSVITLLIDLERNARVNARAIEAIARLSETARAATARSVATTEAQKS
ncbi:MAG: hypothetical protein M1546_16800 [Chloroflexi bacterium]|nr:hypothetical protein [Chloroflexota bacterium]